MADRALDIVTGAGVSALGSVGLLLGQLGPVLDALTQAANAAAAVCGVVLVVSRLRTHRRDVKEETGH